eukprot:784122-Prorocentrum_minimum.AAC.1
MSELAGKSSYAKAVAAEAEAHGPALTALAARVVAFRAEDMDAVGCCADVKGCYVDVKGCCVHAPPPPRKEGGGVQGRDRGGAGEAHRRERRLQELLFDGVPEQGGRRSGDLGQLGEPEELKGARAQLGGGRKKKSMLKWVDRFVVRI